jgi:peptidoglycan hydrolase-like protein with peptidoglycan-binding domain
MKRALLCFLVTLCAVSLAVADETIRSLQQTLKDQGFYYGAVTGDKSAETTAAIRRYQIRNGLRVTGELNDETLGSVNSNSGASKTNSRSVVSKPSSGRSDANAPSQSASAPSFNPPEGPLQASPSYSASFYQSTPFRVNRRNIAATQYELMSRGYYRGRVDGKYGRQMAFAVRAFQSSAGLPPTGRLDTQTLSVLKISDANFAYAAPESRSYETWMPVQKFKHGKWKVKWKRYNRSFGGEGDDEDQRANSGYGALDY